LQNNGASHLAWNAPCAGLAAGVRRPVRGSAAELQVRGQALEC